MKKSVVTVLVLCAVSIAVLSLTACENNPDIRVPPNSYEIEDSLPTVYIITKWGYDGFRAYPGEQFEITDDAARQELLEIIADSKRYPLSEEMRFSFALTSFRSPFHFIVDGTKYAFETQMRLLIVFDEEGYQSEYYFASDFDRAIEIHRQHAE